MSSKLRFVVARSVLVLSVLVLSLLALVGCTALETAVPGDSGAAPPAGIEDLLPAGPGARWTYQSEAHLSQLSYVGEVSVARQPVFEYASRYRKASDSSWRDKRRYRYYGISGNRLLHYGNVYKQGASPGATTRRSKIVLELPLEVGHEWHWDQTLPVQLLHRENQKPVVRREVDIRYRGVIDAVDQEVHVPAGAFRAVQVSIHSDHNGPRRERFWLAPGVGIIKHEASLGKPAWELVHFESPQPRVDAQQIARKFLQQQDLLGTELRSIDPKLTSDGLESRFFVASAPSDPGAGRVVRVFRDNVDWFDPTAVEAWQRHYAEEERDLQRLSRGTTFLRRVVAALVAATHGVDLSNKQLCSLSSRSATDVQDGVDVYTLQMNGKDRSQGRWGAAIVTTYEDTRWVGLEASYRRVQ
ncbi:MAG: hypothetical protein AAF581_15545 [Planctomycetota bacterium]